MKKHDIKQTTVKEIHKSDGDATYIYRLNMKRSDRVASYQLPLYSIEIEMTTEEGYTSNETPELFSDIGRALVFLSYLAEHLVTPLNLPYVIEDAICP